MVSGVASQHNGPRLETPLGPGLFVRSVHVLPVSWVLSGYCGFLLQSKNMQVRSIGHSKLSFQGVCRYLLNVSSRSQLTIECKQN